MNAWLLSWETPNLVPRVWSFSIWRRHIGKREDPAEEIGRHHCGFAKVVICAWAEIQPGSSVPCEQTENNEWFRMNEVSVQIFSGNSRFVFS